jgi:hypothetical protein
MFATHVTRPFEVCGWRERRARRNMNPQPLILSTIAAEYNNRRAFSGWCLADLAIAHLKGKEDHR